MLFVCFTLLKLKKQFVQQKKNMFSQRKSSLGTSMELQVYTIKYMNKRRGNVSSFFLSKSLGQFVYSLLPSEQCLHQFCLTLLLESPQSNKTDTNIACQLAHYFIDKLACSHNSLCNVYPVALEELKDKYSQNHFGYDRKNQTQTRSYRNCNHNFSSKLLLQK